MSLTKTLNSYSFVYIPTETEKLIPYATLQEKLGLESIREVEDLIIEGIVTCVNKIKMKNRLGNPNPKSAIRAIFGPRIRNSNSIRIFHFYDFCST